MTKDDNPVEFWKGRLIVATIQHSLAHAELAEAEKKLRGTQEAMNTFARELVALGMSVEDMEAMVNNLPDASTLHFSTFPIKRRDGKT